MDTELHDVVLEGAQEGMVAWIETHWAMLAAIAWRGYVATGRGLVLLDGAWDAAVAVGYLHRRRGGSRREPLARLAAGGDAGLPPHDRHPVLRPAQFGRYPTRATGHGAPGAALPGHAAGWRTAFQDDPLARPSRPCGSGIGTADSSACV